MRKILPFIILFITLFSKLQAQTDSTIVIKSYTEKDTLIREAPVETVVLVPKRNLFPVRKPIFFVNPKNLPLSLLNVKVNYWKTTTAIAINLNQASFSDNWSAGGVSSIALGSTFNYKAEYNKDGTSFITEVLLQYGKLKNRDQLERKTNDRIFWDNKAATQLSKSWYFFGSLSFESQFDLGYNYGRDAIGNETRTLISRFLSPGYITESVGFEYKPVKYFSLRIGTGTARQTLVLDTTLYRNNAKNYGVEIGKTFRNELAFQIVADFDRDIATNINLKSRYLLFANYDRLNNIDQRLDVVLTAKVNKLINVTLSGTALYDDDFSGQIQSTQALALGIVYKIP